MKPIFLPLAAMLLLMSPPVQAGPRLEERSSIALSGMKGQKIEYIRALEPGTLVLTDCEDIKVFCSEFRSVRVVNCKNVSIWNSWIHDSKEPGILIEGSEDVTVGGCRIENVATGLYALDSKDVRFVGNYVENVQGPMPRGQMVQFDKVSGSKNLIKGNYAQNFLKKSKPEDMVSIYMSNGTESGPIVIEGNYLSGDPEKGSEGKSGSGSGVLVGDGGGSHIVCRSNTLISPGQAGIGVAGGSDVLVEDNEIVGTRSDVANVGIYVWNQSKKDGGKVTVRNNKVSWMNNAGRSNGWWPGGGFAAIEEKGNAFDEKALKVSPPPSKPPMPPGPMKGIGGRAELPW